MALVPAGAIGRRGNILRALGQLDQVSGGGFGLQRNGGALAEDLHLSPATVEKYIHILESLYIVFLVYPFHKNIARAVSRPPKLYFMDTGLVLGNEGLKLENLCAVSLLKHAYFQQDHAGERMNLFYLRDKEGNEVDFLLSLDDQPAQMIEIKSSDKKIGKSLKHFKNILPAVKCSQWELYGSTAIYEDGVEKIPLKEALLKLSC
jgi:predicted AAA+ superfamily ATPase